MSLTNTEFFSHEDETWVRFDDGSMKLITISEINLINELIELISTYYPQAYEALCKEYSGCSLNIPYFRFRIATRFIRCNFSILDNVPDIDSRGMCRFECVPCPLRGECRSEGVICRPTFDHKLSPAELPVLQKWYDGASVDEIAECLSLSPHTISNHIRHAYTRLNVHSRADFIRYVAKYNIFE